MILKKYKTINSRAIGKVIFRRSKYNRGWKCGVDCKIKCNTNIDVSYTLGCQCDVMRGMFAIDDIKYAYYPPRDDTEEK